MDQLNKSANGITLEENNKFKAKSNKSPSKVKIEKSTKLGKVDLEEDSDNVSVEIDPWISEIDFDFNVNESSQAFQDSLINGDYNFSKMDFDLSDLPTSFDDNDDEVMSSNCLESLSQYKLQGKKRKYNPDAVLIASVTEDTLKELKLDPNSKEAKKKRRQIRNRMSAQFHRDRKNAYIEKLEDILKTKEKEIKLYLEQISLLQTENTLLRNSFDSSNVPLFFTAQPQTISSTNTLSNNTDNEDNDSQSLRSTSETSSSPSTVPLLPMSVPTMSFAPIDTTARNGFFSKPLSAISMVCMMTIMILQIVSFNPNQTEQSPTVVPNIVSETVSEGIVETSQIHRRLLEVEEPIVQKKRVSLVNHGSSNSSTVKTNRRYLRSPPSASVNDSSLAKEIEDDFNRLKSSPLLLGQAPASHVMSNYDWSAPFNNRVFDYQSFSSLILTEGKVLLDPSLSFNTNSRKRSSFGPSDNPNNMFPSHSSSRSSSKLSPVSPIQSLSALPFPTPKLALPSSKDITTVAAQSDKLSADSLHLYKSLPPLLSMGGESTGDLDYQDSLPQNMMTGSNIMTLLLPTSTIRLGKTWMESEDSTVESIMNVLNITQSENDNIKMNSHSVSLEVHCVIVGAKLVHHS